MQKKQFGKKSADTPSLPLSKCVAKTDGHDRPGMTVEQHCRIVAHVARSLCDMLPDGVSPLLGVNPETVAALHDIGKVSPGFQHKIYGAEGLAKISPELAHMPATRFESRHWTTGCAALDDYFSSGFRHHPAALVAGMHHGRLECGDLTDRGSTYGGSQWRQRRRELIDVLVGEYGMPDPPASFPRLGALAGLVTVADWIGSDETFFPPLETVDTAERAERAAAAVHECGFAGHRYRPGLSFADIFGFGPYPLQERFAAGVTGPGVYVLEAPMGTGKTEAALHAAYRLLAVGKATGLYFGLPTRLTSDRIHERVDSFLKAVCSDEADVRLAHGHAWLRNFSAGGEELGSGRSWFSPAKRALLHPFAVGTIDQALLGVINVKHFFVRLFGLAGKVVILDEVHSYDMYTGTLLDMLVQWLRELECTVIILSATLTEQRRSDLIPHGEPSPTSRSYPLITISRQEDVTHVPCAPLPDRNVTVRIRPWSAADIAAEAVKRASGGECVVCIANTVAAAQDWYRRVKAEMPAEAFPVGLLHSHFPAFRRAEIEEQWMKSLGREGPRPDGCVLVATQVVEQSVDIDADSMISALAPTDMLLQRMGRLHRHTRGDRPVGTAEMAIVGGDFGSAEDTASLRALMGNDRHVYDPYVLWRTFMVWRDRSVVQLPADIRDVLEATYAGDDENEPAYVAELRDRMWKKRDTLRNCAAMAGAGNDSVPAGSDTEAASTRYNDIPRLTCLLVRSIEPAGSTAACVTAEGKPVTLDVYVRDMRITAELYRNCVDIPAYHLRPAPGGSARRNPDYLRRHFHDFTPILLIGDDGSLTWDGRHTGLWYHADTGISRDAAHTTHDNARPGWDDMEDDWYECDD